MKNQVELDDVLRLDEFGEKYYRVDEINDVQRHSLNWMCREGSLAKHAVKWGNKWFIKKEALNGF